MELIRPNLERVKAALGEPGAIQGKADLAGYLQAAAERLELASQTDDWCLAQLEQALTRCHQAEGFPQAHVARAERLCERLARSGDRIRMNHLTFKWLAYDFAQEENDVRAWRAGMAIGLAAQLPQRVAVPRLLEMFGADWDWWNEEIEKALTTLADEGVLSHVIVNFPQLSGHGQLYASGGLCNARIAGMDRYLLPLLEGETDDLALMNLGRALALYGTPGSMEAACRVYEGSGDDPEAFEIAGILYAYYRILKMDGRPELPGWRQKMAFRACPLAWCLAPKPKRAAPASRALPASVS